MAKKNLCIPETCCKWFPVLLALVGIWFIAADLGWISTYGFTLWPIVVALVGIKMMFKK